MKRFRLLTLTLVILSVGHVTHILRKQSLNERLFFATSRGDAAGVAQLLREGADPNTRDQAGWSVLTQAKAGKHAEVIKIIELAGGRE